MIKWDQEEEEHHNLYIYGKRHVTHLDTPIQDGQQQMKSLISEVSITVKEN